VLSVDRLREWLAVELRQSLLRHLERLRGRRAAAGLLLGLLSAMPVT
jgi:hypothetical protein